MSNQKPIYLMAGGKGEGGKTMGIIVQKVFQETGKVVPVVAYVGVASDDNWMFYKLISGMIQKAAKCKINRVAISPKNADLKKVKDALQSADAIFMSGGDVERGMEVLEEKNLTGFFQDLYQQGKIFFGASAGSIMMAKEWVRWTDPNDDSTAELFPCLGLAPVICDTHAEADDWEELQAALQIKEDNARGYGIASGSCLVAYPDGHLAALGGAIRQYSNHNGKVERNEDLVP